MQEIERKITELGFVDEENDLLAALFACLHDSKITGYDGVFFTTKTILNYLNRYQTAREENTPVTIQDILLWIYKSYNLFCEFAVIKNNYASKPDLFEKLISDCKLDLQYATPEECFKSTFESEPDKREFEQPRGVINTILQDFGIKPENTRRRDR